MNKANWRTYAFEFLSIFVAVVAAFALNNWNDNRRDSLAESKILTEIRNGLEKDKEDIAINIFGHEQGLKACAFWRNILNGGEPNLDTLQQYYFTLTRDFISVQNTSGYETLKSRGFELVKNDSLRQRIISLYEFDYQTIEKLEEAYYGMQFHESYFHQMNEAIAPHFVFGERGNIRTMNLPLALDDSTRNVLLSHLFQIQVNRKFILQAYREVEGKVNRLAQEIEKELSQTR